MSGISLSNDVGNLSKREAVIVFFKLYGLFWVAMWLFGGHLTEDSSDSRYIVSCARGKQWQLALRLSWPGMMWVLFGENAILPQWGLASPDVAGGIPLESRTYLVLLGLATRTKRSD